MFTSNQNILKDLRKVFNFLKTNYIVNKYKHLLVSPHYAKNGFIKLIDQEIDKALIGKPACIRLKLNSITSYKMVDKLYEASNAGVKIQMIVRGVCCLIPGVKGMSENIEAISIIDKYLEHPRMMIFGSFGEEEVFISSSDWMTRNLDNRVEVTCPIYDNDIKKELIDTFSICWNDSVKARVFSKNQGNQYRISKSNPVRSQVKTYEYYLNKITVVR